MTPEQLMLTKLAEEAAEVAQMALKTQQFGMDECRPDQPLSNRERLHAELDDLMGVIEELNREHALGYTINERAVADKRVKLAKYAAYSVALGRVRAPRQGFTRPQAQRLYNNNPQLRADTSSFEAFYRALRVIEAAHELPLPTPPQRPTDSAAPPERRGG